MHDFFGEDCTSDQDGCVVKTVVSEGSGLSNPRDGAIVNVSWSMSHLDRQLESRSVKFMLGDGVAQGVGESEYFVFGGSM